MIADGRRSRSEGIAAHAIGAMLANHPQALADGLGREVGTATTGFADAPMGRPG
jgi:hypothetical protein